MGATTSLKSLLGGLVEPSRHEPGCLQFQLLRRREDPDEFLVLERWRNQSALEAHEASPHVERAAALCPDLLEGAAADAFYVQEK